MIGDEGEEESKGVSESPSGVDAADAMVVFGYLAGEATLAGL